MRTLSSLKAHHRAAVLAAEKPIARAALMEAVPGLTPFMVDFLVQRKLLAVTSAGLVAAPGLREARHEAPQQALQVSSVWEYARRCV